MKRSKKKTLHLLLCSMISVFLLSYSALAQMPKVTGRITNQRNAATMAAATVTIKGINRTVVSDETGNFTINAAPGEVLVITSIGYRKSWSPEPIYK
jgi:hypothetical protein